MLIKHAGLNFQLGKKLPALFFLCGTEILQIETLAQTIKSNWQKQHHENDVEIKTLYVNSTADWLLIAEEANSYSLFSNAVLLDVRFDKKTLDTAGKAVLERYLANINSSCLVLIRAPNLPIKQLQFAVSHEFAHVILTSAPNTAAIKQWINNRLQSICSDYDKQIPDLIHQYNEGNLLACSQVLDKLQLLTDVNQTLTLSEVKEQLINQCDYSLFELAEACLNADSIKALQLLRQACGNKTEPTLILWLLTQEIRLLMQLVPYNNQTGLFRETASQLKIWSNKVALYQSAAKKLDETLLVNLLRFCNTLDSRIKTGQSKRVWQSFELIVLSLCLGKQAGYLG